MTLLHRFAPVVIQCRCAPQKSFPVFVAHG